MHTHITKEKAIYTVINQLKKRDSSNTFVGFLWAPVATEDMIR